MPAFATGGTMTRTIGSTSARQMNYDWSRP